MVSPNFSTLISLSLVGGKSFVRPSNAAVIPHLPSMPGHHIILTSSRRPSFRNAAFMLPPPVTLNLSTPNSALSISMARVRSMESLPTAIHEMYCLVRVSRYSFGHSSYVMTKSGIPSNWLCGHFNLPVVSMAMI